MTGKEQEIFGNCWLLGTQLITHRWQLNVLNTISNQWEGSQCITKEAMTSFPLSLAKCFRASEQSLIKCLMIIIRYRKMEIKP